MQSTLTLPLTQEDAPAIEIVAKNGESYPAAGLSGNAAALRTLILVKNEDTVFRLRGLFKSDVRFDVVSDCMSELEVLSVLERTSVDLLVIDLNLPQLGSKPFLDAVSRFGRVLFVLDPDPKVERLLQNKGLPCLRRDCQATQFQQVATRLADSRGARPRAQAQKMIRLLSGKYRARSSRLAIRVKERLLVLDQGEIYAVEAEGRTTWIHLGLESHQVGEPFSQLSRRLERSRLMKINRRVLVNPTHIKEISVKPRERCSVWLHNDRVYRLPFYCARHVRNVVEALCKA